jgi:hypothetical protein
MGWLRTILGAKWLPYVAIGVASTVLIVFGWGYLKGYNSAERTYQGLMNEALANQLARLSEVHQKDMATAVRKQSKVSNVKMRIKDVVRTDCSLSTECLRAFNDGVRATGTNPKGID